MNAKYKKPPLPGTTPTIRYAKAQTITSTACAAIKTDTVEIITVIKNTAGCDLLSALTARATHTNIVRPMRG
jgi:hypothetical protein